MIDVPHSESTTPTSDQRIPAGRTILIVDDDPDVAASLAAMLSTIGWNVQVTDSGTAALEKLDNPDTRPDLLLTDLSMPGMSGVELVKLTRERFISLPIILMSGVVEESTEGDMVNVTFLHKPFHADELWKAVSMAQNTADEGQ